MTGLFEVLVLLAAVALLCWLVAVAFDGDDWRMK